MKLILHSGCIWVLLFRMYPLDSIGIGRNQSNRLTQIIESRDPSFGGDFHHTYWPQSSFYSSENYLFLLDTYCYTIFNFQEKESTEIIISNDCLFGDKITGLILQAKSFPELVARGNKIFGYQPKLPDWVFDGAILELQDGIEVVLKRFEDARTHRVEITALYIKDWTGQDVSQFYGGQPKWNWIRSDSYANIDIFSENMKRIRNARILGYLSPYIESGTECFNQFTPFLIYNYKENSAPKLLNFGVVTSGGTIDVWSKSSNLHYINWITEHLLHAGFKGWMADSGEYFPINLEVNSNGQCSYQPNFDTSYPICPTITCHNEFPIKWSKLNYEIAATFANGSDADEILIFLRSGGLWAAQYTPILNAGEQNVDWSISDGLPSTITAGVFIYLQKCNNI